MSSNPLTSSSPIKKQWPVAVTPGGTVEIAVSPKSRRISNSLIYRFKHMESERRCVGSVAESGPDVARRNTLGARMRSYKHRVKRVREGRRRGRPVLQALARSPEKMTLGILEILPPGTSEAVLHEREAYWQENYDTRNPDRGYNVTDPRKEGLRCRKKKKQRMSKLPRPDLNPASPIPLRRSARLKKKKT